MGVISRGIKNAFRNTIRTVSVVFILGLSVAMALIMLLALKTVQAKITSVKSSVGNVITVSPAGVRGFEGGGTLLTDQNATDVSKLSNVSSVVKTLSDRLTSSNTNLTSPIEPGSFGNRQQNESNGSSSSSTNQPSANFTMPVMVTGTSDINSLTSIGVSQFTIKSGEKIDASSSNNIAMVGSDLATKNNLTVGSTFTAYGQTVKVSGIYDAGSTFSNATVVMPLKTVQTLSSQAGQVNSIIVTASSIDTVSSVQSAIKEKLGTSVDVATAQDASQSTITSLENIKTISLYSLIGSLVAGAVIIFLIMMMIVRERRREIGVLKAIGSSNVGIVAQFTVESLVLTLASSVIGIILGFIFSNPVLKVLVTNSTSSATQSVGRGGPGGGFGGAILRLGGGAQNTLQSIHAVLNYDVVLYGLLVAIVIAILGSAIPAYFIAKVRPAEVMRAE